MDKVLQDIWIITSDGIVLFSRVFDPKLKNQLFGALMSALESFAKHVSSEGLSNFELSEKRFSIKKKHNLIFAANYSKKEKEKKANRQLDYIIDAFFNKYPVDVLKNWDGDVSPFSDFEDEIKDTFKDPVKNFWNGF